MYILANFKAEFLCDGPSLAFEFYSQSEHYTATAQAAIDKTQKIELHKLIISLIVKNWSKIAQNQDISHEY